MKILVATLFLALSGTAQMQTAASMPPLVDRELFFGDPEITGAQLSPDGKYIAFLKPWNNTRNIWVKKTGEPFSNARLVTAEPRRPLAGYFWSRDGKYLVFAKDKDGDENFNVYAVDPSSPSASSTTGSPDSAAPYARDLTQVTGVQVQIYSVPKNDPDTIYVGLNDRDKSWHDLYKVQISTGAKTLVRKNTEKIASWTFDEQGNLRLAQRSTDSGDTQILRVEASGFQTIYTCSVFESCGVVRFEQNGKRAYMETNKGDKDLVELALLNPATGDAALVESDPLKRVDFGNAVFAEDTGELVVTNYTDDRQRRYFRNKAFEADFAWLSAKLPGREIRRASTTADESLWLVNASSDVEPGETYLFDRKSKTLTLQYRVREKLPREALSPMTSIRYKSSDGLEIPAYLTIPKATNGKSMPVVVVPHGGPWGRDVFGYNSIAQFLSNRGYAVLMPNFRASTGFGKKFLNAGNGEWGRKMQDDITWGVKYLIAQGIADPKRIGIMGGSYGGYATLAGVAFTPDVYRAAVDIVGPSNLVTLLDAIPPYWESARKVMYARMADAGTPEGKKWLEERSPLHSADKIRTPLMVVQGANDPRVNRREADQIVIALRDRKYPVEYLVAPDEGHGFARPINNLAMFMAIEKFLASQLDGRYQQGGSAESVARLKEITVDPATVMLAKKVDTSALTLPKSSGALKPGVYKYSAKAALGTQEIAMKISTEIKEGTGGWNVVEKLTTPMGEGTDQVTLEKGSLIVLNRNAHQGPLTLQLDYGKEGKVTGKMSMNGQDRAISTDLGGPAFADAAGSYQVLATLPLAEGFTASIRNFDTQKAKLKMFDLKVTGSESATVPAGTFDTWKVELTAVEGADRSTIWVSKDQHTPVKIASTLASMGGAQLTAELEP